MDSLKLRGAQDSPTPEANDYVFDAKDRLRRLANRTAAGMPVPPPPSAAMSSPVRHPIVADSLSEPREASVTGLDSLRSAVVDRAVDRLVERFLQHWERGGRPESALDVQILDRLVERLVSRLETGA